MTDPQASWANDPRWIKWRFGPESRRCDHEWGQWDGTNEHGIQINDRQCARLDAKRIELFGREYEETKESEEGRQA